MAPVDTIIVADMLTALRGIRREDGYHHDVRRVVEGAVGFESVGSFPTLALQLLRDRVESQPSHHRRRTLRFSVTGFVRPPSGMDRHGAARELIADVDRALAADPTRGGAAVLTEITDHTIDTARHESGARVQCVVQVVAHDSIGI